MKLFRLIAIAIALGIFLCVPSLTTATNSYTAYIACGYKTSAPQATTCSKSGRIGAFFMSNDADVSFRTCVTFPDSQRKCTQTATAKMGIFYVNKLTVGSRGTLTVRWKVHRVVVATYSIQVTR